MKEQQIHPQKKHTAPRCMLRNVAQKQQKDFWCTDVEQINKQDWFLNEGKKQKHKKKH